MNWKTIGKWVLGIFLAVVAAVLLTPIGYGLWLAYGVGSVI